MKTKSTPEEIQRKKEYVRFLSTQIYKLTSQQNISLANWLNWKSN